MRKHMDRAYRGFTHAMADFVDLCLAIADAMMILVINLTLPLWIVPYTFYRHFANKRKGGK